MSNISNEPPQKKNLNDYYNWLSKSNSKETSLSNEFYPAKYALEASITDMNACFVMDKFYNNYSVGWREPIRNSCKLAKEITNGNSLYKPSWNKGYYDKNKNSNWKKIKEHYPTLSNRDKINLYDLYGEEYFKEIYQDPSKEKVNKNEDNILNNIKTKLDLYNLIYKMYNFKDEKISLMDIHTNNMYDELNKLKYIIFVDYTKLEEFEKYKLPCSDEIGMWIRNILSSYLNLQSSEYMIVPVMMRVYENSEYDFNKELYKSFDLIETILDNIPKNIMIISMGNYACERFGIKLNENNLPEINKYNKTYSIGIKYLDENSFKSLFSIWKNDIDGSLKRRSNKNFTSNSNDIFIKIKSGKVDVSNNMFDTDTNLDFSESYQPNIQPIKVIDCEKAIKKLDDGWTYITTGSISENEIKKDGSSFKKIIPYLMMRKGKEKKIIDVDPKIDIYYSQNKGFKVAEDIENLTKIEHVSFNNINLMKSKVEANNNVTCWYNTDLPVSVYTVDILRNKLKYKEGNDPLRIWYFDIEAEPDTIKVEANDESISGRLRLYTIFDTYDKIFYCCVRKDKSNKNQDINIDTFYEKLHDKEGNLIESGPFKVIIKEVEDERDMFKYFNYLMCKMDPDIITGWNSEKYDMSYMYVRGKTLGIPLMNKYSEFYIVENINQNKIKKYVVNAVGVLLIDYLVMYKFMDTKEKERYNLDYICEIELGGERKKNKIEVSHNYMYSNKLKTYLEYNIVDVYRIVELEQKFNYFKYQVEFINICNVSWDDIYHKTKSIDGLLYNHLIKDNMVLKTKNKKPQEFMEYKGALVLESIPNIYEEVADLDLKSLYPSIMIRYNLLKDCMVAYTDQNIPETWLYNRKEMKYPFIVNIFENGAEVPYEINSEEEFLEYLKDKIYTMFGTIYYKPQVKRSYISDLLIFLMEHRGKYKKLRQKAMVEGHEDLYLRYNIIQDAYKRLANSIYGVMGVSTYRLFDIKTASSITASGREITRLGAYHISKYMEMMAKEKNIDIEYEKCPISVTSLEGLELPENRPYVIYGDTDSVFTDAGRVARALNPDSTDNDEKIKNSWNVICKTSDYINKYLIHEILKRKGIDPNDEFSEYNFFFKTEYIASKAIFLDVKKSYAWHLVMENGDKIDEIKIKGLAPIKSSFSKLGKDCAGKVLEYILTDYDTSNKIKSNKQIGKIIDEFINKSLDMCKTGERDIGVPCKLNDDISTYASIGAHVRGMMIYDTLFDHEYKIMDKGYRYKITDIAWEKLGTTKSEFLHKFKKKYSKYSWYNTIAVKHELDLTTITIPADSDENLNVDIFKIDEKSILDSSVYERVRRIVSVLGITALTPEEKYKQSVENDKILI